MVSLIFLVVMCLIMVSLSLSSLILLTGELRYVKMLVKELSEDIKCIKEDVECDRDG